jgi:hypothetical protein
MQQESVEQQSTKPSTEQGGTSKAKKKATPKPRKKTVKKSEGLGDTISKVTEATGIDKVVKAVVGEDCGCDERRKKLNSIFPYAKPMTKDDKETFETVLIPAFKRSRFTVKEQNVMNGIYSRVFGKMNTPTSCGSCVLQWYRKLNKAYENYCENES